jgi:hypothetical protein
MGENNKFSYKICYQMIASQLSNNPKFLSLSFASTDIWVSL